MPKSADPAPTLGWETIASGKYGPGVRSRHGLVYDRSTKAVVLFGGVVWTPEWNLQADTWELHGRKWSRIRTPEAPPARHRGVAMIYMDNPGQTVLFGGQGQTNRFLGDTWTYAGRRWQSAKAWEPLGHLLAVVIASHLTSRPGSLSCLAESEARIRTP